MGFMKIRTYLKSLLNTIASPIYYVDVLNAPFSFSVKFFLVSYLLLTVLATSLFTTLDVPKYQTIFDQTITQLEQNFPPGLSFSWNGSVLTSTLIQPLQLPFPEDIPRQGQPTHLLTIAPLANSLSEIKGLNPDSLLAIGKTSIYAYNKNGKWTELSLTNTPGFDQAFVLDKSSLPTFTSKWKELYAEVSSLVTILFPVIFFFGIGAARLFSIVINGVFIFFLLRLVGKGLPYKKVIQISLHIVIVAELIDVLTSHFVIQDQLNMYGLAFWAYLIVVLASLWNVKSIVLMRAPDKN